MKIKIGLLAILFAQLLTSCSKNNSNSTHSRLIYAEDSRYLYTRDLDDNNRIMVFLADEQQTIIGFQWMERLQKVAVKVYETGISSSSYSIYLVKSDGSEARKLLDTQFSSAVLSPNGIGIIYLKNNDLTYSLIDGSEERNLTNKPSHYKDFSFSPDGSMIIYSVTKDYNTVTIYTMGYDGSNPQKVMEAPYEDISHPKITPDGKRVYFAEKNKIMLSDFDGQNRKVLIDKSEEANRYIYNPYWSTDRKSMAFTYGGYCYITSIDGSNVRKLNIRGQKVVLTRF